MENLFRVVPELPKVCSAYSHGQQAARFGLRLGFSWDVLRIRLLGLSKGQWLRVKVPTGMIKNRFAYMLKERMNCKRTASPTLATLEKVVMRQHPTKAYVYLQPICRKGVKK